MRIGSELFEHQLSALRAAHAHAADPALRPFGCSCRGFSCSHNVRTATVVETLKTVLTPQDMLPLSAARDVVCGLLPGIST